MKTLLLFLFLCGVVLAANDGPTKPAWIHEVGLRKLPLEGGERIASIEVEVEGASFETVHIPNDWSFDIVLPSRGWLC